MKRAIWIAAGTLLLSSMLGCSSSSGSTAGSGSTANNELAPVDTEVPGLPEADGGTYGKSEVDLDPTLTADPEVEKIVTLSMDPFIVQPNEEVFKCQDFANPFGGEQVDIKAYELHMSPGSHHMFEFYKAGATDGPLIDCPQGGLEFGPFTFTSQTPHATSAYPETVGAAIPPTMGFHLNAHYINTTSAPLTGHVQITMYIAKTGVVTQHAGVVYFSQDSISVPPTGQPSTSSATCALPQDVNLMYTSSHMHQRSTNFTLSMGAQTLFQTANWDAPTPAVFAPALALKAGTNLTWSCTYVNDTGSWLTFGESALTNVMCISVSAFYPVQDITNPVIQCMK